MYYYILFFTLPTLIYGKCTVNLDNITGKNPPLLLQNWNFIYPTSVQEGEDRIITFEAGDDLELFCHNSARDQYKTFVESFDTKFVDLKCSSDGKFYTTGAQAVLVNVEAATCTQKQQPLLLRKEELCSPVGADGRKQDLDGKLIRVSIGWDLHGVFHEQIGACIDEKVYGTIWTNHTVDAQIELRDMGHGRPGFRTETSYLKQFFTWTSSNAMTNHYSKNNQLARSQTIYSTGNKFEGNTIIDTSRSGTYYFAKGHLAPDAGFFYDVFQAATYYFFNVAPQFQSFNNGNWKALEMATRKQASTLGRDLKVTTGTSGLLKYPDNNGIPQPFYLFSGPGGDRVPVPQYFWKVVEDPETQTATAFVGVNDPHRSEWPEQVCTDRCSELDWVTWKVEDQKAGFMYCCSVEDARRYLQEIPASISARGLLGGTEVDNGGTEVGNVGSTEGTCTAGPCTCTCAKNSSGVYTCTCTCNDSS